MRVRAGGSSLWPMDHLQTFAVTVAVIATSVNAHCDFDLTKPTEHWAGNGGIDISPSVKQLNQMILQNQLFKEECLNQLQKLKK